MLTRVHFQAKQDKFVHLFLPYLQPNLFKFVYGSGCEWLNKQVVKHDVCHIF